MARLYCLRHPLTTLKVLLNCHANAVNREARIALNPLLETPTLCGTSTADDAANFGVGRTYVGYVMNEDQHLTVKHHSLNLCCIERRLYNFCINLIAVKSLLIFPLVACSNGLPSQSKESRFVLTRCNFAIIWVNKMCLLFHFFPSKFSFFF